MVAQNETLKFQFHLHYYEKKCFWNVNSMFQYQVSKSVLIIFIGEGMDKKPSSNCHNMTKQKALHFQLGEFLLICFQNVNFSTYNGVDYTIRFLLKVHKGKKKSTKECLEDIPKNGQIKLFGIITSIRNHLVIINVNILRYHLHCYNFCKQKFILGYGIKFSLIKNYFTSS